MKMAEKIKTQFCRNFPSFVVAHWNEQLFSKKDHGVKCLPIVITSTSIEQIIAIPKLECLTGKEQALAICNALQEQGITNNVEILDCDTTDFTGVCVLIEIALKKKCLNLPCRRHILELVLRAGFEVKIKQIISSPESNV